MGGVMKFGSWSEIGGGCPDKSGGRGERGYNRVVSNSEQIPGGVKFFQGVGVQNHGIGWVVIVYRSRNRWVKVRMGRAIVGWVIEGKGGPDRLNLWESMGYKSHGWVLTMGGRCAVHWGRGIQGDQRGCRWSKGVVGGWSRSNGGVVHGSRKCDMHPEGCVGGAEGGERGREGREHGQTPWHSERVGQRERDQEHTYSEVQARVG
eukprot:751499-Hanusia_phi.AAC.2